MTIRHRSVEELHEALSHNADIIISDGIVELLALRIKCAQLEEQAQIDGGRIVALMDEIERLQG